MSEEFVLIRPCEKKVNQFSTSTFTDLIIEVLFFSLKDLPVLNSIDDGTLDILSRLIQPYIEIMFIIVNILDMVLKYYMKRNDGFYNQSLFLL